MTTTTERPTYEGWTNYETWAVKLWLDSEAYTYHLWRDRALALRDEALTYENEFMDEGRRRVWQLAEELSEWHEEQLPELQGFAADLLNRGFGAVNFLEIAQSLIEG